MLKVARFVRYEDDVCRVEILWMPLHRALAIEALDRLNPSHFVHEERLGELTGSLAERMHGLVMRLESRSVSTSVVVDEAWAREHFDWDIDEDGRDRGQA